VAENAMDGAKGTANDVYALDTGDSGAPRLRLLDHVYGASTRRMLEEAGLSKGSRILDLACGIGAVSCWLANEAGATGQVVAGDVNPDQLVVAKWHCAKCEHPAPIQYIETSAYATGLPAESFDIVHMRLLLCHLTEPDKVLNEVYRILRPGGALVCQDLHLASLYSFPESRCYTRIIELCLEMGKRLGVNYNYGLRLPAAAASAGFRSVEVRLDQPAYLTGQEKRLWEYTFAELFPSMIRTGVASADELQDLLDGMREVASDNRALIAQACLLGVIAVK
jgi:ubiquinone/menaquinone biosynthesis C-methylase UbiE